MRRLPQNLSLLAVSVLTMSSFAVAPVFAEHGSNDTTLASTSTSGSSTSGSGSTTTTTTTKTDDSTSGASDSSTSTQTEAEVETSNNLTPTQVSNESGKLRAAAAKLLATQRQDKKAQTTVADRQKACTARQAEITTREQNYAKSAQKHLDTFNTTYARVLQFQTDKKLTSADLTTLKTTADAKKAAAAAAVAALSSTDLKVDCTAADPAATVATLKTAVSNARTALQDYRSAVKDLTVALGNAVGDTNSSSDTTTTGSTNTTTTTTTDTTSTGGVH